MVTADQRVHLLAGNMQIATLQLLDDCSVGRMLTIKAAIFARIYSAHTYIYKLQTSLSVNHLPIGNRYQLLHMQCHSNTAITSNTKHHPIYQLATCPLALPPPFVLQENVWG